MQPLPLKRVAEGLGVSKSLEEKEIFKLFTNALYIHPPEVCSFCYAYVVSFISQNNMRFILAFVRDGLATKVYNITTTMTIKPYPIK